MIPTAAIRSKKESAVLSGYRTKLRHRNAEGPKIDGDIIVDTPIAHKACIKNL